jgi:hypothetical protein
MIDRSAVLDIFNKDFMSNITIPHQLTWTEAQWQNLFQDATYPSARLAIVLFAWHQIVFIGRYIPYVICDHVSFLRKYRIQKVEN